ncbi:MAG: hypothetical protein F4Y57_08970 [Acidobacteria bacterium]|nr:hypothetical protein [Acidobacteriota bacterium]
MAFIKYKPGTVESKNNYIVPPANGTVVVPADAATEYLRAEDVHHIAPYGDGSIVRKINSDRPGNAIAIAATPKQVAASVSEALTRGYRGEFEPCECPKCDDETGTENGDDAGDAGNDPPAKQ